MALSEDVLFLPASAQTVSQDEINALESKRIRRLRELGDWRPSSGWKIEPSLPPLSVQSTPQSELREMLDATRPTRSPRLLGTRAWLHLSGARQSLHGK